MIKGMLQLMPALTIPVSFDIFLDRLAEGSFGSDLLSRIHRAEEFLVHFGLFDQPDLGDLSFEIFVGRGGICLVQPKIVQHPFPFLFFKRGRRLQNEEIPLFQPHPFRTRGFVKIFYQQRIVFRNTPFDGLPGCIGLRKNEGSARSRHR